MVQTGERGLPRKASFSPLETTPTRALSWGVAYLPADHIEVSAGKLVVGNLIVETGWDVQGHR